MIPNAIKRKWQAGLPTINAWLSIGNPFTAEIMAAQGYDSLTVDIQHGFLDYGEARGMFQAVRASGATILSRVPWLDPGIIMKVLDAGAYGVICPMVNTADQAAALVEAVRYPPHGSRSFGPTRANYSAGANYAAEANDEIVALAMVETAEAVANVEAICATPGLDGIYIGPADLTLGVTQGRLPAGFDREEPEMIETIRHVLAAAKAAGVRAGLHCGTPEYAARAVGWGFDMVTISGDARLLAGAAGASVRQARELLGTAAPAAPAPGKGGY
ncbi:MAG: 2,4-dihydroxyhept-2-ene-1,7-dioic acid aldolase [Alphaproteobacteria bacterium]|jgi:4-hydroxy-2-oxoheptanedioate aldolase|nr:2,4-dihydroxyhept-2-ene-1,7-dioic acid aldolase [Alphaproteobacteria bacterium]